MYNKLNIIPIILCGGSGKRLWPLSRKSVPKQFIPLFNGKSLLDLTLNRLKNVSVINRIIIICNERHAFMVKHATKRIKLRVTLLLEPEGKDTTAAIYLASKIVSKSETLLIMPSDHLMSVDEFRRDIKKIVEANNFNNWITLGIKPTKPATGYGYIKVNSDEENKILKNVDKFIEKPPLKKAKKFLQDGNYFWNSGIFLGRSDIISNSIEHHTPDIAHTCNNVLDNMIVSKTRNEIKFLPSLFSQIPSKSIDFSVLEKEKNIKLFLLTGKWSDVGSWDVVADELQSNNSTHKIFQIDSENNFIKNENKIIATIGVKDLIIVQNDNATLIAKRDTSEKVKLIVEKLTKKNILDATEQSFEIRPWGKYHIIDSTDFYKVKRLEISPKKRLSLQYHNLRSEHWLVVKGEATIHLKGNLFKLKEGMSIDIPVRAKHYIHNDTNKNLIIIEIQFGTYLEEDDIIRIDDPYNR